VVPTTTETHDTPRRRFIDTGNFEWVAADEVAVVVVDEHRNYSGEVSYTVDVRLRNAVWDDDAERWTPSYETCLVDDGDAQWCSRFARRFAETLVDWLTDGEAPEPVFRGNPIACAIEEELTKEADAA